ncbi:MAG: carbohydrate binding family 9 domain-containing protein [Bryobacteraceae bacterium]
MAPPSPLGAADVREAAVHRLTGEIQIDGNLNESVWRDNPDIGTFVQNVPHSGEPPSEPTQVWLAYSKDALYIAVRCHDRSPGRIVATEMRRDAELQDNDSIEIVLDTYHDHRNAYYFATNPAGALVDGRITENKNPKMEWDGIWNVRTRIDGQGWTAEFEIPFKTIGFSPGLQSWGFNISRRVARLLEVSRWASPSFDVQLYHAARAGEITGLDGLSQGIGLDVKPYGIAGFSRDIEAAKRAEATGDGGVDFFYRITPNLISSTTVNTDFAETEVDTRQVNLTRFPLFFPEKRSFFLEDAGVFDFAQSGSGGPHESRDLLPFFSRTIGLVGGREVPIRIGEKLTGKVGRFDLGLMDVQTGDLKEQGYRIVPGTNLAVGRAKANFLSQSYIGAMFTNGDPAGVVDNSLGGVDLKLSTANFLKTEKNMSLTLFGSKTRTTGVQGKDAAFGGVVSYPNDLIQAEYKWMKIEENFNAALGFVPRVGVRISSGRLEAAPRPDFWNIRQARFSVGYSDFYNLRQGASETSEVQVSPLSLEFNGGEELSYEWRRNTERLFEPWEIHPGIVVPVGRQTFNSHTVRASSPQTKPLSVGADYGWGSFYTGTRKELGVELTWRRNRHLTTAAEFEQNWIRLSQGSFKATLFMYRLDYAFTPFVSLTNFVQYDTDSRNIGLQSRLRWILTPGNEFFIVFNQGWQQDQLDRFQNAQSRFRFKLSYTFRF